MQISKASSWAIGITCLTFFYLQAGMAESDTSAQIINTSATVSASTPIAGSPLAIMGSRKAPTVAAAPSSTATSTTSDANTDGMTQFYKPFNPQVDVTPSARGCPKSSGPYFTGSFIYWKSKFDVLDTAVKGNSLNPQTQPNLKVTVKDPSTKYSPGFKVGAGYNINRDVWDTYFNWTWLESHTNSHVSTSNHAIINLLISPTLGGTNINKVNKLNMDWRFHFNSLDWELARNFFIGRNLSLRPFAGLKAGWIHTHLKVKARDVTQGNNPPSIAPNTNTILSNENWGIGPRVGINTRWVLSHYNFGFVANVAGALLWEDVDSKIDIHVLSTPGLTPSGIQSLKLKTGQDLLAPVAEVYLGLDWGSCFSKKRFYFSAAAGFEMQYWAKQQQFGTILATNPNNDLNMYGLTASLRIDF